MKRLLLLLLALSYFGAASGDQVMPPPPSNQPDVGLAKVNQITITQADWQELRAARSAAIHANPSLTTESKKLMERMRALEDKLDAAMVKADPTIAPIIAKFEAGRQRQGLATSAPRAPSPAVK